MDCAVFLKSWPSPNPLPEVYRPEGEGVTPPRRMIHSKNESEYTIRDFDRTARRAVARRRHSSGDVRQRKIHVRQRRTHVRLADGCGNINGSCLRRDRRALGEVMDNMTVAAVLSVILTAFFLAAVLIARWYEKRHPDDEDHVRGIFHNHRHRSIHRIDVVTQRRKPSMHRQRPRNRRPIARPHRPARTG